MFVCPTLRKGKLLAGESQRASKLHMLFCALMCECKTVHHDVREPVGAQCGMYVGVVNGVIDPYVQYIPNTT